MSPSPMSPPARISITEVGPRDGLQNEPFFVPTERKIVLIEALIGAGLRSLEVASFVSPRAVPQMADAAEVVAAVRHHAPEVELVALVPNAAGAARAAAAGVGAMSVFLSASESHNLKNPNRTRAASLEGLAEVAGIGAAAGIPLHGTISTAFGCPFEGDVPVAEVVRIARAFRDLGIRRLTLGDTTGMATQPRVAALCRALAAAVPEMAVALHFHNTRGLGLVCVQAGLAEGITRYESSVGGLGGCPFVPAATGNVCTEDLVYLLDETGVDLEKLIAVAARAQQTVGHPLPGQVMKAGPRLRLHPLDAPTARG